MAKTTKRRKVWVTTDKYGPGGAFESRKLADDRVKRHAGSEFPEEVVRMVESRPGDVVLSREDVGAKATEVAQDLVAEGFDVEDAPSFVRCVVRALLRGGR